MYGPKMVKVNLLYIYIVLHSKIFCGLLLTFIYKQFVPRSVKSTGGQCLFNGQANVINKVKQ